MSNNQRPAKTRTASDNTYMYVYDGELRQKLKEHEEGCKERYNQAGTAKIYEVAFDAIEGRLLSMGLNEKTNSITGDKSKELQLKLKDAYGIVYLSLPMTNRYAIEFLKKMPNVDLTKDMKIYPSLFKETPKDKYYFSILQPNAAGELEKIKNRFTKDTPCELPPAVKVTVGKKDVWDFTEQNLFYELLVENVFKIQLLDIANGKPLSVTYESAIKGILKEIKEATKKA